MLGREMMVFDLLVLVLVDMQFGDCQLKLLEVGLDFVLAFEVGIDDGVEEAVVVGGCEEVGLAG